MKPKHPVVLARERYEADLLRRRKNPPKPTDFVVRYDRMMRESKELELERLLKDFRAVMLDLVANGAFRT